MAGYKEFNSKARATQAGNPQNGSPFTTSISRLQESRAPSPTNIPLLPPALYAEPDVRHCGMSLGQLSSAVLSMSPPRLCPLSLLPAGAVQGAEQGWVQCRHCSATAKTIPVLPVLFPVQSHSYILAPMKQINYPSQSQCIHSRELSELLPHYHKTTTKGLNHPFLGHTCSQLGAQGFKVT